MFVVGLMEGSFIQLLQLLTISSDFSRCKSICAVPMIFGQGMESVRQHRRRSETVILNLVQVDCVAA